MAFVVDDFLAIASFATSVGSQVLSGVANSQAQGEDAWLAIQQNTSNSNAIQNWLDNFDNTMNLAVGQYQTQGRSALEQLLGALGNANVAGTLRGEGATAQLFAQQAQDEVVSAFGTDMAMGVVDPLTGEVSGDAGLYELGLSQMVTDLLNQQETALAQIDIYSQANEILNTAVDNTPGNWGRVTEHEIEQGANPDKGPFWEFLGDALGAFADWVGIGKPVGD